jgi:hypothetical protein
MAREADIQNTIRIEGAKVGVLFFRNNVGVLEDRNGRPVRFGLANDSAEINRKFKSSDLIGIWELTGQFVAVEVKEAGWKYNPNDAHEAAQFAFLALIRSKGGIALFATSWEDVNNELKSIKDGASVT